MKKRDKGKGPAWMLEGSLKACKNKGKDGKCKDLPPKIKGRSDESVEGERLEKRFKHDKGKGNAWPIEGAKKPCKKIGKDGECEDQPPTLDHRDKGKGPAWMIEGNAESCKNPGHCQDPSPKLKKYIKEEHLEKRFRHGKGYGNAWPIEGLDCKKDKKNDCPIPKRSDDNIKAGEEVLEKRRKGKGAMWVIEGTQVPADPSLFCDYWIDTPKRSNMDEDLL